MDIRIPFLAFFFVALVKLIRSITPSHAKPSSALRLPPGPWQLPLVGSLHHLLLSSFRDLPHRALLEMSGTYGPLMLLRLGSVPTLVVSSAEAAGEVMKTHDLAFCSRHLSATIDIISCGGKGIIFSQYNEQWRQLRKLCACSSSSTSGASSPSDPSGRKRWRTSSAPSPGSAAAAGPSTSAKGSATR